MNDPVRDKFTELSGRLPEGVRDPHSVFEGGRLIRRKRRAMSICVVGALAVAAFASFSALVDATQDKNPDGRMNLATKSSTDNRRDRGVSDIEILTSSKGAYVFQDLEITRLPSTSMQANFTLLATPREYPWGSAFGKATCSIRVFQGGRDIGQIVFDYQARDRRRRLSRRFVVSGVPDRATASCKKAKPAIVSDDKAKYRFSEYEYERGKRSSHISFTIEWIGKTFPGTEEGCHVVVSGPTGTRRFGPFSMTSADRSARSSLEVPLAFEPVEEAHIDCS